MTRRLDAYTPQGRHALDPGDCTCERKGAIRAECRPGVLGQWEPDPATGEQVWVYPPLPCWMDALKCVPHRNGPAPPPNTHPDRAGNPGTPWRKNIYRDAVLTGERTQMCISRRARGDDLLPITLRKLREQGLIRNLTLHGGEARGWWTWRLTAEGRRAGRALRAEQRKG